VILLATGPILTKLRKINKEKALFFSKILNLNFPPKMWSVLHFKNVIYLNLAESNLLGLLAG